MYGPDGEALDRTPREPSGPTVRPPPSVPRSRGGPKRRSSPGGPPAESGLSSVPISFPGEGRVAGAVEAYVDASRVSASVRRARTILWALAAGSGGILYVALYGIVWRASRTLETQHVALVRRAEELARANAELRTLQDQLVAAAPGRVR